MQKGNTNNFTLLVKSWQLATDEETLNPVLEVVRIYENQQLILFHRRQGQLELSLVNKVDKVINFIHLVKSAVEIFETEIILPPSLTLPLSLSFSSTHKNTCSQNTHTHFADD